MRQSKSRHRVEFGDFQTPPDLARRVVNVLADHGVRPRAVVEPTCGEGNFLNAAVEGFASVERIFALDIDASHVARAQGQIGQAIREKRVDVRQGDFFAYPWPELFKQVPQPILVIGNPPWVTASELGALNGRNLPRKSNFQNLRGIEAITGRSNFDIAEWMLIRLLDSLVGCDACVAMLVKTSVARKVLRHVWQARIPLKTAVIYTFDAQCHFNVSASACLLVCDMAGTAPPISVPYCEVCELDSPGVTKRRIGYRAGALIANLEAYDECADLMRPDSGVSTAYRWRSGLKHDCAKVMELRQTAHGLVNGLDERVMVEPTCVFPLLKGSDVARGESVLQDRRVLVTQHHPGEETSHLRKTCPATWRYLCDHAEWLDGRSSTIYRNAARFSVFGVGPYAFQPWKIAISGLYKRLAFTCIGPREGRPVIFDDTVYYLACDTEGEAARLTDLLNSDPAKAFYGAFVFWDAKRPITVDLLQRLDLTKLAHRLDVSDEFLSAGRLARASQMELLF